MKHIFNAPIINYWYNKKIFMIILKLPLRYYSWYFSGRTIHIITIAYKSNQIQIKSLQYVSFSKNNDMGFSLKSPDRTTEQKTSVPINLSDVTTWELSSFLLTFLRFFQFILIAEITRKKIKKLSHERAVCFLINRLLVLFFTSIH